MYFINIRALSERLRKNTLTESEKFAYFLMPLILDTSVIIQSPEIVPILRVITIVGISSCFFENSAGDNKDFIVRYTCLSWPISIILLLCVSPFWIFDSWLHYLNKDLIRLLVFCAYIARYIWICWEIKKISIHKIELLV